MDKPIPIPEEKTKLERVKKPRPWWTNFLLIFVINIFCLIGMAFILNKTTKTAKEVNELQIENLKSEARNQNKVSQNVLDRTKSDADKLKSLFPNEDKLLEFINQIDDLKRQNIILGFSAASDEVVKDKTGYFGVPISIEIRGTEAELNNALTKINQLSVIINPVLIEMTRQDGNIYSLKIGGFLYVDETFN